MSNARRLWARRRAEAFALGVQLREKLMAVITAVRMVLPQDVEWVADPV